MAAAIFNNAKLEKDAIDNSKVVKSDFQGILNNIEPACQKVYFNKIVPVSESDVKGLEGENKACYVKMMGKNVSNLYSRKPNV